MQIVAWPVACQHLGAFFLLFGEKEKTLLMVYGKSWHGSSLGNWSGEYAQSSGAGCEGGAKVLAAGLL